MSADQKGNLKNTIRKFLAASLGLILAATAFAQPSLPPPPTNLPAGPSPAQIAAAQAALAAAEIAAYSNNIAPWTVTDLSVSQTGLAAQAYTNLLTLSTNLSVAAGIQQAAVSNFVATNSLGLPLRWMDAEGHMYFFDHFDEGGAAAIKVTANVESAQTVGAQKLWPGGSTGYNLTGTNVLLAQWDGGDVRTNHVEFATNANRVSLLDGSTASGVQDHPTHVAGTLAAWGVTAAAKGFANRATVTESDFGKDLAEMPTVAATKAVRESNHSYSYTDGWFLYTPDGVNYYWFWNGDQIVSISQDWHFGFYNSISQTNDEIVYAAQTYLPVFAAGNENDPNQNGPALQPFSHYEYSNGIIVISSGIRPLNSGQGGFNTLSAYAVSKNNLVVGAVGANTNGYTGTNAVSIANFASQGPTADGRIRPDVVADGVNVYSTFATNTSSYGLDSGTSMSAPAVTGTLGLLTSLYNQFYGTNNPPLASTLKGIVIQTADQLGTNIGPSYTYGWGLLDAVASANLISNNYASGSLAFIKEVRLVSGDYITFPVQLTNGTPFRATITWTDPPGTPTGVAVNPTNHMLVNDLDLRVYGPTGTTNFPYVLNRASPTNAATKADNNVDNVEQVYIPSPTNGTYAVQVTHKGILKDDLGHTNYQNLSIMLSGNIAQPPIGPVITQILPVSISNSVAIKWSGDVGRVFQVQSSTNLSATNWTAATGELSATKTNLAVTFTGLTNNAAQFYRILQVR